MYSSFNMIITGLIVRNNINTTKTFNYKFY